MVFNLIFVLIFGQLHQAGIVPIMQKLQYQSIGFRNCEKFNNNNDHYYQCEIGDKIILPGSSNK